MEFERPDIENFFRTYNITQFAVSKDESRIALATNLSGVYNVWGMDLPTGYPYPLTFIDQSPADIRFDPAGRFILASFDQDGDENTQIYALPSAGGALTPVRTAQGRRHYVVDLSQSGEHLYYCSDKENHQFLNGYLYDLASGDERILYVGEGAPTVLVDVARDESSFITIREFTNTHAVGYVHRGDEVRCLTPDPQAMQATEGGAYLGDDYIFATDFGSDRTYVARHNLTTGAFSKVLELPAVDLSVAAVHVPSRTVYIVARGSVDDRIYAWREDSGAALPVDGLPTAVIAQVVVGDSGALYVLGRSDVDPQNLYRRDPDGDWHALTSNRVLGVAPQDMASAEVVRFPSFDGLMIEALFFQAHPQAANGWTVVWPHGGPQASERRSFRPFFQYLCNRGYNVWAPNFRGSSGYGSAFAKMVEGDWGTGPRLDMVESMEWLIKSGRAQRDKLFLVGGSYGGYMTLLLHGRHAEYFQACVDIFGPANLLTFVESVPDHWKPMMKTWLGDPVVDRDRLVADSPITYIAGMTKPMLVIQGANDPRVVKAESDQIVQALRDRGVEVQYLVFEDEGHGFMKKSNELMAYRRAVEFLDSHRR